MIGKIYNLAVIEMILWAISLVELFNDAMRAIAFLGAIATLVLTVWKFMEERKVRKKQNHLVDLQIEEKVRTLDKLKQTDNE